MDEIQYVLVDIDDTLIPTNGTVPQGFYTGLAQLERLMREGALPRLGGCSGREDTYCRPIGFLLGRPDSWWITESGVTLFNPKSDEIFFNPLLTQEVREAFLEELHKKRIPRILRAFPDLVLYHGKRINIALELRPGSSLTINQARSMVEQELSGLVEANLVTVRNSSIAVDISPPGIDKAAGVRFLCEIAELEPSQILGIGDSPGDFPMLEMVGALACPGNATPECKEFVKQRGGYVAHQPLVLGVLESLSHFLGVPNPES